jgi:AcrR family transcriptional regulator
MFVKPEIPPPVARRVPKQVRGKERVERILSAALAELEARGVDAATMTGIAERAGVPIGSVYQFFPSKAAILGELARRYSEQGQAALVAALGADAADVPLPTLVDRLVGHMAGFHQGWPGYAVLMDAQSREPEVAGALLGLRAGWLAAAEALVAARAPHLGADDRELVALMASHAVDALKYLPWCDGEAARQRLLAETKALLLRYLQPYDR